MRKNIKSWRGINMHAKKTLLDIINLGLLIYLEQVQESGSLLTWRAILSYGRAPFLNRSAQLHQPM